MQGQCVCLIQTHKHVSLREPAGELGTDKRHEDITEPLFTTEGSSIGISHVFMESSCCLETAYREVSVAWHWGPTKCHLHGGLWLQNWGAVMGAQAVCSA